MTESYLLLGLLAVCAGAVASVAGFGIGSLLTPALTPLLGIRLAVAAVALPHVAGTGLRLWRLRAHVDRALLRDFGVASAAGGLLGALLHDQLASPVLFSTFGLLLILSGLAGFTRWPERAHLRGPMATLAGAVSGMFGGLVGNQGSIRSAALLGSGLSREQYVATATATALLVDAARVPVYLFTSAADLREHAALIGVLVLGVSLGTIIGERLLRRLSERGFRLAVSTLLLLLGGYMLLQPA